MKFQALKDSELRKLLTAPPPPKTKHMRDGAGLFLQVTPNGGKTWVYEYFIAKRRRTITYGGYPKTTLKMAREFHERDRALVADGIDPRTERDERKAAAEAAISKWAPTFAEYGAHWLRLNNTGAHPAARQKKDRNVRIASDCFGSVPVADVTRQHIVECAGQLWTDGKFAATKDFISDLRRILNAARSDELRNEGGYGWKGDLADAAVFRKENKKERIAREKVSRANKVLAWTSFPDFMSRLRADDTIEARALEFMTLTAARPEDVIGYRAEKPALDWCEIDLDAKLWTLPAERAKTGTDHVVPLSGAAVAILEALPHRKGRVFNGAAYHGGLSENALLNKAQEVAAAMEGDHVTTARNLSRKTFRTWATDNRVEEEGIIELCLAHAVSEIRSSSTYYKGDAIDRKKHVFDAWAAFADGQSVGDNVVKLHA